MEQLPCESREAQARGCPAGTPGHPVGSGNFLCLEGREDNVAPANSTGEVCPQSQRAEGACEHRVWSHPSPQNPHGSHLPGGRG